MLPADATCASAARAHVRRILADLRLPAELIDDASVAVSELATNAWRHALDGGALPGRAGACAVPPELWVYRRGTAPGAELVCGVFDARRDAWPQPRPNPLQLLRDDEAELADSLLDAVLENGTGTGHGLSIVAALSAAAGCHRTRSRFGDQPVPGKVAWFTMNIPDSSPAAQPPPASLTPAQAARKLKALLTARGIAGLSHHHATPAQSAVSIHAGLTVRCRDETFQWAAGGDVERRAYSDLADVLEDIIRLHEDTPRAGSQMSG
jgi:hypothetical protein